MNTVRTTPALGLIPIIFLMTTIVLSSGLGSAGIAAATFSQSASNQTLEEINQAAAVLNRTAPELMNQTAGDLNQTASRMGNQISIE